VPAIKITSAVDAKPWAGFKALAIESQRNLSGLLTEAIRDYVRRHRVRLAVLQHLEDSMRDTEELGRLLAQRRSGS
jgi:hypothetical protein